jgi:hypothetical protein
MELTEPANTVTGKIVLLLCKDARGMDEYYRLGIVARNTTNPSGSFCISNLVEYGVQNGRCWTTMPQYKYGGLMEHSAIFFSAGNIVDRLGKKVYDAGASLLLQADELN